MKSVLFVCIENSNRSQMAQAFAIMHGKNQVRAHSAGSRPSRIINPKAIAAMKELGYNLGIHDSKGLNQVPQIQYDYLITMGCGDACPYVMAKNRIDWQIPDPGDVNEEDFRKVRDLIEEKVKDLLQNIPVSS